MFALALFIYGFQPSGLSIHKYLTYFLLLHPDARLHLPDAETPQLLKKMTHLHHLRKKLPKIPPNKGAFQRLLGRRFQLCHTFAIWDGKILIQRA